MATVTPNTLNAPKADAFCAASLAIPAKELPISQLVALLQTLDTMVDIAAGMGCRPGLTDLRTGRLNGAGSEFDDITGYLSEKYLAVLDRLRDATAMTKQDQENRRVELLKFDLGCCQDTTDAALAAVVKALPHKF